MTDEATTWRAASFSVPPNTPVGCYVGDAQLVMLSHKGSENVCITVSRPDTLAEAEPAPKPAELPVDRCIRLMGELEEALGDGLEGPGLLLPDWRVFTRDLGRNREHLERTVAAVRGPQPDPEEWVECQWTTGQRAEGTRGVLQVCVEDGRMQGHFSTDDVWAWNRRKPRGIPRWAYDQLKPVGDS